MSTKVHHVKPNTSGASQLATSPFPLGSIQDNMYQAAHRAAEEYDKLTGFIKSEAEGPIRAKFVPSSIDVWAAKHTMAAGYKWMGIIVFRQGGKSSSVEAVEAYAQRKAAKFAERQGRDE